MSFTDVQWNFRLASAAAEVASRKKLREAECAAELERTRLPPPQEVTGPTRQGVTARVDRGVAAECPFWFGTGAVTQKGLDAAVRVSSEDLQEVKNCVAKGCATRALKARLWLQFLAFLETNPELAAETAGICMALFLSTLQKTNCLKSSTVVTYSRHLRQQAFASVQNGGLTGMLSYSAYVKRTEICSMHESVDHAVDIPDEYIAQVLGSNLDLDVRVMVWIITVSSGRADDLLNIVRVIWTASSKSLAVDWGKRKNSRRRVDQSSCSYECPPPFLPSKEIAARVKKWDSTSCKLTARRINEALKTIPFSGDSREGKSPTTYSFRRHAIQRFIADLTDDRGCTNWSRVIELTGHISDQMPRHTYNLTATAQAEAAMQEEEDSFEEELLSV